MAKVRCVAVFVIVLAMAAGVQAQQREGGRRSSSRSLLGLLRMEQVQKEMKLTEEQKTKVMEVVEKLGAEMRKQMEALGSIEDRGQRRTKMNELADQADAKLREQLRGVVEREQLMRLYQIRMQVRPAVESLANQYVARRLEITEEQKAKLAEIAKDLEAKQGELYGGMRDATDEQRSQAFQKMRTIRTEADEKALAVLTDAQKKSFEEMKGAKFELPAGRGPQ